MSQQTLDVRGFLQAVRRHRKVVIAAAVVGLAAGAAFTVLRPPMLVSKALIVLPSSASRYIATQAVIASSDPVLSEAIPHIDRSWSVTQLRKQIKVTNPTSNLVQVSAEGTTAAQAEKIANAVAHSYATYVSSTGSPARVDARVLEQATPATGTPLAVRLLMVGGLGALVGAVIGALIAVAMSRRERRLRQRDDIADAIGVPVLASVPVGHPSDPAGWLRLLEGYQPQAVHAWSLRKAMQRLGLTDVRGGSSTSVVVLSLSSDPGALAVGPQLAAFASSLGIPTMLVVGHQQNANATATLSTVCSATPTLARRSGLLRLAAGDDAKPDLNHATLIVIVAVVDGLTPEVSETTRGATTVLAVSAGAATADQLARVAVSAADDRRDIAGIIVADPDPADRTTGRLPQPTRPAGHRRPTRLANAAGTTTAGIRR
jgi:capsular polysaccharide biosynthesis protein